MFYYKTLPQTDNGCSTGIENLRLLPIALGGTVKYEWEHVTRCAEWTGMPEYSNRHWAEAVVKGDDIVSLVGYYEKSDGTLHSVDMGVV